MIVTGKMKTEGLFDLTRHCMRIAVASNGGYVLAMLSTQASPFRTGELPENLFVARVNRNVKKNIHSAGKMPS